VGRLLAVVDDLQRLALLLVDEAELERDQRRGLVAAGGRAAAVLGLAVLVLVLVLVLGLAVLVRVAVLGRGGGGAAGQGRPDGDGGRRPRDLAGDLGDAVGLHPDTPGL